MESRFEADFRKTRPSILDPVTSRTLAIKALTLIAGLQVSIIGTLLSISLQLPQQDGTKCIAYLCASNSEGKRHTSKLLIYNSNTRRLQHLRATLLPRRDAGTTSAWITVLYRYLGGDVTTVFLSTIDLAALLEKARTLLVARFDEHSTGSNL